MNARRALCVVAITVVAMTGCNAEKRRLLGEETQLERQREAVQQRIDSRRAVVLETQSRLDALRSSLAEHNSSTHAYILQHQAAAACIRAATMTLADDNEYRAQVGAMARLGTAVCAIALLNERFAAEVTAVTNYIADADRHARRIKDQIAVAERLIESDRSRIQYDEEQLDRVAADLADVRHKLSME